jgi:hypothetical protein
LLDFQQTLLDFQQTLLDFQQTLLEFFVILEILQAIFPKLGQNDPI